MSFALPCWNKLKFRCFSHKKTLKKKLGEVSKQTMLLSCANSERGVFKGHDLKHHSLDWQNVYFLLAKLKLGKKINCKLKKKRNSIISHLQLRFY